MGAKRIYTDQDLIQALKEVKQKIGKIPTKKEYQQNCQSPSYSLLQKTFGGLNNACRMAFGTTNYEERGSTECSCGQCGKILVKHNAEINASKTGKVFCNKSCSATYSNTHKTYGHRVSMIQRYVHKKLFQTYPCLQFQFNKINSIGMQLDISVPKINIAFQINGIFHYESIYGEEKLKAVQENDKKKIELCKQKNIQLFVIDISKYKTFKDQYGEQLLEFISNKINSKYVREYYEIQIIRNVDDLYKRKMDKTCLGCNKSFISNIRNKKFCCEQCNSKYVLQNGAFNLKFKNIPTKQQLMKKLQFNSYGKVGKEYGVFANTVKQWGKKLGIDHEWVKQMRLKNSNYHNQYFKKKQQ